MELEELGKAISEAIALRQLMVNVEGKIFTVASKITANKKEIARLETLKLATEDLGVDKGNLEKELAGYDAELQKRLEKLNKVGVELPINKETAGGVVSL